MKRKPEMGASDLSGSSLRLPPDIRPKELILIFDALKICFPNCASVDLNELMKMAEWLEEEIFTEATTEIEYLYRVLLKIQNMKTRFQTTAAAHSMQSQVAYQGQSQIPLPNLHPQAPHQMLSQNVQNTGVQISASLPSALPSVTTAAAGQSANMQPGIAQNSVGNSVSQGVPSNIFSNTQRQMQGRRQSQQIAPQLQQQPSQNQKQKQKQKLQHEAMKQKLQGNMQQNQLLGQQNSIPDMQQQQRLVSQQNNMSNMQQQQSLSQQNNISNLHQQQLGPQNSAGAQSSASFPPALPSMTSLTQTSVPNAAGQRINMQSGIGQNFVGQGNWQWRMQFQQFSPMLQHHLLQNPLKNPQIFSSLASMNSNAQAKPNAVDLLEEIYQMIQSMKQNYLPPLNEIYRKISEECQQLKRNVSVLNVPQCEEQKLLDALEWRIQLLNVSKDGIVLTTKEMLTAYETQHTISGSNVPLGPQHESPILFRWFENQIIHLPMHIIVSAMKDVLSFCEDEIIHLINSNCPGELVSTELQIQQPGGHLLSTQPQQQPQQQQQQEEEEEEEEVDNQPDATHEIINVTDSSD